MEDRKIVLITGGSGYIGSSIVNKIAADYEVVILDTSPPAQLTEGVQFQHLDMKSELEMVEVLSRIKEEKGHKIHSLIHLAGHYDFKGEKSPLYEQVNIQGSRRLLQCAREFFDVGQFIFASSMLVYAPSAIGQKITEDSPLEASWIYPESKIKAEKILREHHGNTPLVILRIAAVYNDYGYAPSIAQQIMRVHEMQLTSFLFPGNRYHVQSAVHVDDLAEAVSLCLLKKDELPAVSVMSVAEDETPTYDEIQRLVSRLSHKKELPYFTVPKILAKVGAFALSSLPVQRSSFIRPWMIRFADANYHLDNSRIKDLLGWSPKRSLRETLPLIVRNLDLYPGTWYRTNKSQLPPILALLRTKFMKNVITE